MSHIAMGLSLLFLLILLPALFDPKKFKAAVEEFLSLGNGAIRMTAFIPFFIAFFILNTHWTVKLGSSRSIMTVLGYLLLLKGLVRFWFPSYSHKMIKKFLANDKFYYAGVAIGLVVALGIGYLGVWVY